MAKPHAKDQVMQEHLTAWELGGLTQTDYCKQVGIKRDDFSYYKKKLLRRKLSANQKHQLVPVQILDGTTHINQPIKISHRNGFSLDIQLNDDLTYLKPILNLLSTIQ